MLVLSEGKNSFGRPKIDHVLRYNFIEERADFQAVFCVMVILRSSHSHSLG